MKYFAPNLVLSKLKIKSEIAELNEGESFRWGRSALLLISIKMTDYWETEANSFSEWLNNNLGLFKVKRASVWRYFASGIYYQELLERFPRDNFKPLEQLSSDIGPEKLELLSKIQRVAPTHKFEKLVARLLSGDITKPELLKEWNVLKTALEGQTARGRGVRPPRADETSERSVEAVALSLLGNSTPAWSGIKDISSHRIFHNIDINSSSKHQRWDAVAAIYDKFQDLTIHGIEIKLRMTKGLINRLEQQSPAFDFVWLLLFSRPKALELKALSEGLGVLIVNEDKIECMRKAKKNSRPAGQELLLKNLLYESLS